eukprot:3041985-Pleurochrysis_carterae.AAC.1
MPAATAAAKKKAFAASETSGQERVAALSVAVSAARSASPQGVDTSQSCVSQACDAATVGGDGEGEGVRGDPAASDSALEGWSDGSWSSSESRGGGSGNNASA